MTFSTNGANAAKNTTATFIRTGAYNFEAAIRDAGDNLAVTSKVAVSVVSALASLAVSPDSTNMPIDGTEIFTAAAFDQFGGTFNCTSALLWAVSGGGTIGTNGLFTACGSPGGPYTVTVSDGRTTGSAAVTICGDWNTNGIPDDWEKEYNFSPLTPTDPLQDSDADGMPDCAEYVAGTDPTNEQSRFTLQIAYSNRTVVVSYPGLRAGGPGYAGRTRHYGLESTRDLAGGRWDPVPDATNVPGADVTVEYTNSPADEPVYYRGKVWLE